MTLQTCRSRSLAVHKSSWRPPLNNIALSPSRCRRYYIGSDKLAALGWKEEVQFEDGLKRTIDWYLSTTCEGYWAGDVESALQAHPVVSLSSQTLNLPFTA